ncbi:enoyl-[acyl-carrier-protein] reductase, mitochondrial [Tachypleus tridentatus]|uniref:enoyl-[acyl-carrier-protein] reductase, mitochondrial n=1 Tax=Tachypleus tridentatus TaxID=6853 RepID=UPI003FD3F25F
MATFISRCGISQLDNQLSKIRFTFLSKSNSSKSYRIHTRLNSYALQYNQHGDPIKVLQKIEIPTPKDGLKSTEVEYKMLAAPVNPADINMIQGTYPVKPPLPAIGGNEGVAQILKVGSDVKGLHVGAWVIPNSAGWGTWRTQGICDQKELLTITNNIPVLSAATIAVNPCSAYRLLNDFGELQPGDTVIQNGANSGVGQAVIQIAHYLGFHTINVVRNRENLQELKDLLVKLGADYIIVEEELRSQVMDDIFKKIPKPKLALNCVGGKNALEMMRHLAKRGTMVTYGGMSRQPVTVPTSALIFKDTRILGYWMTQWNKEHSDSPERRKMLDFVCDLARKGVLRPPNSRIVPFRDYKEAIEKAMAPFVSQKQVLVME